MLTQVVASAALAGEVVHVKTSDLAYFPAEVTARVGDTIEWENNDFIDHTATAQSGAAWDIAIPAGKTARVRLDHEGTITYFCRMHPTMTGAVNVIADR